MTGLPLEIHVKEKVKQVKLQSIPNIIILAREGLKRLEWLNKFRWWAGEMVP